MGHVGLNGAPLVTIAAPSLLSEPGRGLGYSGGIDQSHAPPFDQQHGKPLLIGCHQRRRAAHRPQQLLGYPGRKSVPCPYLRADYGPTFTQRKGVTDLADPPCVHRKGLRKIVTTARAVIGPLTRTRHRRTINVHDYVEATARSLRCVNVGP